MCAILSTLTRLLPLGLAAMVGCASFSNPTTFPSVPVRRCPDEILGKPREEQLDVPQALLRQRKPEEYRLDAGDIIGFVLEGVIGSRDQPPPVTLPQPGPGGNKNIGLGYPIPVLDDGTISLPLMDEPVSVKGMTIPEAQKEFRRLYAEKDQLQPDTAKKLLITLFRPRQYHVLVVRQDSSTYQVGTSSFSSTKRGSGQVLELPAYENDVLTALTLSGGLPGLDAKNEIIIQRGYLKGDLTKMPPPGPIPGLETVRVPLRLRPGEDIPFKPQDVILSEGDIVFIQSRDTEVFYTGGLLIVGEWQLPRDYDLDVLKAVAQTKSPLANGGVNFNNLQGNIIAPGVGSPSPSQLTVIRRAPGKRQITIRVDLNRCMQDPRERILVQPGDFLILQESMGEAFARYFSTQYNITAFLRLWSGENSAAIINTNLR